MKLYHSPLSPYVRKVMVVAHELGLMDRIETVDGTGTPLAPNDATLAANPVGRIPALVTEDMGTLVDRKSLVIVSSLYNILFLSSHTLNLCF